MRMRQKVSISQLPIRLGIFLLLYLVPQSLSAQENNDSTHILRNGASITPDDVLKQANINLFPEKSTTYSLYSPGQLKHIPRFSLKRDISLPYQTNPSLLFRGDYSTSGVLRQFPHGMLFGSGGQTSVPGIGRFNNASLGYQHAFNQRLTLQLGVDAMKINMIHSTGQAFSTSGALRYQASDRVAFKVFGSYAIGNTYGMDTHRYGATMSLDMSERFGMEVGVQRYYDAYRGRWETVPVVIPYYNFDKFKLSLDVGGILYEILRNTVFDNRGGSGGATIAPPRFQMPPLR